MIPIGVKRILCDPLLHFLVLGACLFGVYHLLNLNARDDPRTIVVDRNELLTYLQYRSNSFDEPQASQALDGMSKTELKRTIDEYVQDEALYREAKALRLDQQDYGGRLRLIRQLQFVTQGFASSDGPALSGKELEMYYNAHREKYYQAASITFTQVFFNRAKRGPKTKGLAQAALKTLNRRQVPFIGATAYGDRFLYQTNYVHQQADLVASHFGTMMANELFALLPSDQRWYGPLESPYGFHLVMVTQRTDGRFPELAEIRERVLQDAMDERGKIRENQMISRIVTGYTVHLGKGLFAAGLGS